MRFLLDYILEDIQKRLERKTPFSIVRLGDGDLKILEELHTGKFTSKRFSREGYTKKDRTRMLNIYRNSCNNANYISGFDVCFNDLFWRSADTGDMLSKDCIGPVRRWKEIYRQVGITNTNYCSPEIGWQFFLKRNTRRLYDLVKKTNLLDLIKKKRIGLVTCYPQAAKKLRDNNYNVTCLIKIPGRGQNHFREFERIKVEIGKSVKSVDIFLVGAGAVGRGYSNFIKNKGGIAIDIGKVMDMWAETHSSKNWGKLYKGYVRADGLTYSLTKKGKKYERHF